MGHSSLLEGALPFEAMFMAIIDFDQVPDVDLMLALLAENVPDHSFEAFVPLNQRAVAIEGQPLRARCVSQCHWSSPPS